MKKLLIVCAFVLGAVTFANAQGGRQMGTPEERAKRSTDMIAERLKLNEDQKTKVSVIYTEQAKTMTKVMTEANGDREVMREKMTKLRAEDDAKIMAVLTDDQKKEFKAWQEERAKQMQNRPQGGGGK